MEQIDNTINKIMNDNPDMYMEQVVSELAKNPDQYNIDIDILIANYNI